MQGEECRDEKLHKSRVYFYFGDNLFLSGDALFFQSFFRALEVASDHPKHKLQTSKIVSGTASHAGSCFESRRAAFVAVFPLHVAWSVAATALIAGPASW